MSIVNKYQLGQRLWPVLIVNGRAFVNPAFTCEAMWREAPTAGYVVYGFRHDYGFPEWSVFASEAEALAARDKINATPAPAEAVAPTKEGGEA